MVLIDACETAITFLYQDSWSYTSVVRCWKI